MKSLFLSTLLLVACTTSPKTTKETTTDVAKPGAPTVLESQVGETSAKLNLRFERAGENVSVVVSGIDGLTVTSAAEVVSGASVKMGEVKPFEVTFTGRGQLVVSVRGTFGGATQARVHSVAIGEVVKKKDGQVQTTSDGDTVKLMP
jgi:hypothetical protein